MVAIDHRVRLAARPRNICLEFYPWHGRDRPPRAARRPDRPVLRFLGPRSATNNAPSGRKPAASWPTI